MGIQQMLLAGGGASAWVTTASGTPSATRTSGWNGYTMRQTIGSSLLVAGSKLRFTLSGHAADTAVIGSMYVHLGATSGDLYDYDTTPIQVLFGGLGSYTLSGGVDVVTDEVALSIDGTRRIVMAWHFNGATTLSSTTGISGTDTDNFWKLGNDATTVNASGYTETGAGAATPCVLLTKVEVLQP